MARLPVNSPFFTSLTAGILGVLLQWHIAIVPLFYPKLSGIHNGQMTVSAAPAWKRIFHTHDLQQPDGAMLFWRIKW
ncbi:MAG: hypothetical protein ACYCS8_04050 [Acidithiobacillus sp.]